MGDDVGVESYELILLRSHLGLWDPHTSFGGVPDTFRSRWSGGGAAKLRAFSGERVNT
ncbi:hypothetical protein Scep_016584 [Stephania cephalantha]|uniref:Uncharacterized protein n=1 Tax=Stephania cephalantha TaxID=152367 RepID=A0AAP0IN00_9MAGN